MSAQHLAEGRQPGCAPLDFAGGICDNYPEKTQKNDSQSALPGEADFVQRHRQASLWHTRCQGVSGRNRTMSSALGRPKQFLTSSKTAPHSGTWWLFESWKIFAVLTHISTRNYCKDYFECRVHSSFASFHALLQTVGQICWDGPLVEKMWVPLTRATQRQKFLRCIHRVLIMQVSCHTHGSCRYPANIWSCEIQLVPRSWFNLCPAAIACWKSYQKRVCGLDCESQNRETIHSSIQAAHSHHYGPAFSSSSGDIFIVLFRENPEGGLPHSWCSPLGWPDSRASPERDAWSLLCAAEFQKSQTEQESSGIWHKCACHSASWDGWQMNTNASSTPATGTLSLH